MPPGQPREGQVLEHLDHLQDPQICLVEVGPEHSARMCSVRLSGTARTIPFFPLPLPELNHL